MDIEKEAREMAVAVANSSDTAGNDLQTIIIPALRRAFSAGEESARKQLVGHFKSLPPEVIGDGKKVAKAIEGYVFASPIGMKD